MRSSCLSYSLKLVNIDRGESVLAEDLTQAIKVLRERIAQAEQQLAELQEEEASKQRGVEMITPAYHQFKSWADEFDTASMEQKKMIACQLFKRIEVGRDYAISVELNMTYQQFCTEWNNTSIMATV